MDSCSQLWPWALFVLLAAPWPLEAQGACPQGACYPPAGDLLLGRAHLLRASSTCGLTKPETYCTPHSEWSMKCCRCDSRLPHVYNGHRVENILSSAGHARWWQSQNGIEHVSLQLDLDQTFQLSSILLHFRSPLPAAMLVERSTDMGRTWQVYQYWASDCAAAFPRIPRGSPESWQDPRCQALQGSPGRGGTVKFSIQDLASTITTSYSQTVDNLGQFTNLRINFTELAHIPRQGYHSPSTFFAVTEMGVRGSCFCHGHADRCTSSGDPHGVVPGHCLCQHNTAGPHCGHCAALYNDRPWAPAEDNDPHECQSTCDPDGTVPGSACDPLTGRCVCKDNVQGERCHLCKPGFAQLAGANPLGCRRCTCNVLGTRQDLPCECDCDFQGTEEVGCDKTSGWCLCRPGVTGPRCDQCQRGHCSSYPGCPLCHPCFRAYDRDIQQQSLARVGSALAAIREQVEGINPDLRFLDETASLSRELEALNSSLLVTNTQYQSKRSQFETSRSTDLSGAFKTIRSAYQTSTNASSLAAGTSGLLAESRESRRRAAALEQGLAEASANLLTLKGQITSSPNLTPVINQICGGSRVETCTPAHCEGLLCPPDPSPTCRIETTETSVSEIQSSTRRLVEQVTGTRTQMEGDVRRIQQFIQQVRSFLSDKDMDPATIQQISESVLSLHLPTDAAAVLRKMTEIQNMAAKLQCPENILAQTAEDMARAKQLQQQAEQARNRANAMEGNVEEVLGNLRQANTVLLEARGAIRGSSSSLRFIQERVDEIEAVLGPAEKNLQAMVAQLAGLGEQLSALQGRAAQNRQRGSAVGQAGSAAGQRARSTQQAFEQVKQMYTELKGRMEQSPALGEQGSRVQSIDLEAQALFEETLAMMLKMETLEVEIQESNKALMSKSARLSGLEKQVGRIRDAISKRVAYYESCS
ncbi:PREDICTED: laminin subunit beta-3 [Chaetura pelagica]|uniref:laminin subunit beta-3 n=1 Tax=Chaetura pelagica TaxID=8897 RepID=UPI000523D66F|nr:PREDICTED: laminin subunit beta-3 [Chaetura pelagica]